MPPFALLLGVVARAEPSPEPAAEPVAETAEAEPSPYEIPLAEMSTLRGYAELRGSWTDAEGTPWTLVERLRPTLKISPSERFSLETTLEANLEQGRYAPAEAEALIREEVGDELFDTFLELYGCTLETERTVEGLEDVLSVERLFVDLNLRRADIRVGRQALNWGSAYIFNPTDVFSEVIVAEPWRERQGVDAARVTVPLGERAQVVGVAGVEGVPEGELSGARGGLRATWRGDRLGASLVGYTDGDRSFGGVDIKGDLGVGWWLEGGYDGDLRASLGADYSFPVLDVLYVAAQVSWDGSGSSPEDYDWTSLSGSTDLGTCEDAPEGTPLAELGQEGEAEARSTMGRLYAVGMLNWTLTESWSVGATTLWNLEDGTGLLFPTGAVKIGGRTSVNAGVQMLLGEDGEFRPPAEALDTGLVDLSPLMPRWTALAWARYSL